MAKPVKGAKESDESALQKIKETRQYLEENLKQFSQETLMGVLTQFDEIGVHLKAALDWRVKQALGGAYINRLNKSINGLVKKIANIEQKLGMAVDGETAEVAAEADGSSEDVS